MGKETLRVTPPPLRFAQTLCKQLCESPLKREEKTKRFSGSEKRDAYCFKRSSLQIHGKGDAGLHARSAWAITWAEVSPTTQTYTKASSTQRATTSSAERSPPCPSGVGGWGVGQTRLKQRHRKPQKTPQPKPRRPLQRASSRAPPPCRLPHRPCRRGTAWPRSRAHPLRGGGPAWPPQRQGQSPPEC